MILKIIIENVILSSSCVNKIIEDSNLFFDTENKFEDYKNEFICVDYSADMLSEKYYFLRISDKKAFVLEIVDEFENISEEDIDKNFKLTECDLSEYILERVKNLI